ncbi:MAG: twin-arginine translocase TatA/TatE family subunit [Gemmatimonadales bacterium]|nr:MAG: twin-arginine translocase TatA/TatE family subunit [Gemmatimonadales bacterium]
MFGLGITELLLILGLLVLVFGAKKIPLIARGLGQGIRNFKGEIKAPEDDPESRDDSSR